MENNRRRLLTSVAEVMADYRTEDLAKPTAAHVEQWLTQFPEGLQDRILKEIDHVLKKTYLSERNVRGFLTELSTLEKLTGGSPKEFWKRTRLLNIQKAGSSQGELLGIFDTILQKQVKVGVGDCSSSAPRAVYIDDIVFSGGHVRHDLSGWVRECKRRRENRPRHAVRAGDAAEEK